MTQALILISPSSENNDKEPPIPDDISTCGSQGRSSLASPPERRSTFPSSRKALRADATNASSHRTKMPSVTPNQLKTATPHEPSQSPSTVYHRTETLYMHIVETTDLSSRREGSVPTLAASTFLLTSRGMQVMESIIVSFLLI
ncbi:hypothetical protein CCHR01_07475 [Colletotrichum chrysophilum]|uniref:Uncharacterized protein n=1 Tax=Colletotrichum chrysophilum TaxID=1836956 RepID=A0AAD9ALJ1_9PEZI|nr:hypothetical protein CCHR01_07475 [Colletotrichum chrysophilum]